MKSGISRNGEKVHQFIGSFAVVEVWEAISIPLDFVQVKPKTSVRSLYSL